MKRIIFVIMIGSIVLTGCGIRDKDNEDISNNQEINEVEQNDVEIKNQISVIESVLNSLDQLEINLDDITDEDLVNE